MNLQFLFQKYAFYHQGAQKLDEETQKIAF